MGVGGQRQPIILPMEAVLKEQEMLQWAPAGGHGVSQSVRVGLSKHEDGSKKAPLSWASGQSETSPGSEHMWWKTPWAAGDRGSLVLGFQMARTKQSGHGRVPCCLLCGRG